MEEKRGETLQEVKELCKIHGIKVEGKHELFFDCLKGKRFYREFEKQGEKLVRLDCRSSKAIGLSLINKE